MNFLKRKQHWLASGGASQCCVAPKWASVGMWFYLQFIYLLTINLIANMYGSWVAIEGYQRFLWLYYFCFCCVLPRFYDDLGTPISMPIWTPGIPSKHFISSITTTYTTTNHIGGILFLLKPHHIEQRHIATCVILVRPSLFLSLSFLVPCPIQQTTLPL